MSQDCFLSWLAGQEGAPPLGNEICLGPPVTFCILPLHTGYNLHPGPPAPVHLGLGCGWGTQGSGRKLNPLLGRAPPSLTLRILDRTP